MDVEQTKRMNHMIQQLTAKGVVTEFDDAVDMAKNLYDNAMPESFESMKEKEGPSSPSSQSTQSPAMNSSSMEMIERKINYAILHNNEKINEQLEKIWNEIKEMKKASHQVVREPSVQDQMTVNNPEQPRKDNPAPARESHPVSQDNGNSPRIGEFSPENVQLENFFYYGK